VLVLHTLRFADELVPGEEIEVSEPGRGPGEREVKMAARLIDTLHARFDPEDYEDQYRAAVLDVIKRKAKGEQVAPEAEAEAEGLDGAKKGGR
jgi:DNA end-binding protein Ku